MDSFLNHLGQPVGFPVENWQAPDPPSRAPILGRYCRIEPLDTGRHAVDLFLPTDSIRKGVSGHIFPMAHLRH